MSPTSADPEHTTGIRRLSAPLQSITALALHAITDRWATRPFATIPAREMQLTGPRERTVTFVFTTA
jgi:hypothetical protein